MPPKRRAVPYGVNVRLTEDQHSAVAALQEREDIGLSEAVRRVIDEWRQGGGSGMVTGVLVDMTFTGVPELGDHIEFAMVTRTSDGQTRRVEFNVDSFIAEQLRDQLDAALDAVEGSS